MASRFWVTGGTGNWNSTTNWSATTGGASGASVPGSSDAALLDASSGSGTVTLDISPTIQTLTCTGFTGTLAFGTNTISLNSTGTIFTGATTMTVTGTPQLIATNSSATARTITATNVTEANSISFRITAGTGTLALSNNVRDVDFTDGTNPTGYAGALGSNALAIYGNLKASTGMTVTPGAQVISFFATSGTKTINTAGVTFDRPFTFNGVGGTFQLQAALTSGATRTVTLTNGTLDLASYTLTTGLFASSNSNTRFIAFGTGNITLTGNNASVWNCGTLTNFSYTGTSNVIANYSGSTGSRTITHGGTATGTEANSLNFNITAGSDTVTLTSTFYGRDVNFTGFSGNLTANSRRIYGNWTLSSTMTLNSGTTTVTTFAATSGTKTITFNGRTMDSLVTFDGVGGTWSLQDAFTLGSTQTLTLTNGTLQLKSGATSTVGAFATSGTNQKYLQSTTPGTQATISQASGVVSTSYLTIQDIYATGGATWNAFYYNGNLDNGNNTNWIFGESPAYGAEYEYKLRSFTEPRRF
jgi:hypothetical protein